jgi:hypothetical protein
LQEPLGNDKLQEPWDGYEESKEGGYEYNEDPYNMFKFRRATIFKMLEHMDIKIQKEGKEYFIEFDKITKELVKRAFKL